MVGGNTATTANTATKIGQKVAMKVTHIQEMSNLKTQMNLSKL
jgi:hypothetical protein